MLLFVVVMVCLSAATMTPHRPPPRRMLLLWPGGAVGGGLDWKDLGFALQAQAWLRLAACVMLPAAFLAATVAKDGYSRSFCLGALLPAAMPLLLISLNDDRGFTATINRGRPVEALQLLGVMSDGFRERVGIFWFCMPILGLSAVLVHWLLRLPKPLDSVSRRSFTARLSFLVLLAAIAITAMIAMPISNDEIGAFSFSQLPVRLVLCLIFPAMLGVGAIHGRGIVRAIFGCGLLPALVPAVLSSIGRYNQGYFFGRWESPDMVDWRYLIVLMWALIPVFGMAAALFYWLFGFGEATDDTAASRVQERAVESRIA